MSIHKPPPGRNLSAKKRDGRKKKKVTEKITLVTCREKMSRRTRQDNHVTENKPNQVLADTAVEKKLAGKHAEAGLLRQIHITAKL